MVHAGAWPLSYESEVGQLLYSSVMEFSKPKARQELVTLTAGFGRGPGLSGQVVSHTGLSVVGI